jgi:LacI family repressor for deo operon, udp, cdd, tsx, nupC, and nupG
VAGFDDIASSSYLSPRLTTVRVEAYRLGERAVQLLLDAMRVGGTPHPTHETLPTTLVVRDSSGARSSAPERVR